MVKAITDTSYYSNIANAIREKGVSGTFQPIQMPIAISQIPTGGLPAGFSAIATGTHTISSDVSGGSTFSVTHNLGVVPDLFMFYTETNIATTYTMLYAFRCSQFGWRSTSYLNLCGYHGNATTTATCTNVTTSYGIKSLTTTKATITTYNTSTTVFWRAGTYKWIAIKF